MIEDNQDAWNQHQQELAELWERNKVAQKELNKIRGEISGRHIKGLNEAIKRGSNRVSSEANIT